MLKLLPALLPLFLAVPAAAETHQFGPFLVDDQLPMVLVLAGPIAPDTPINFDRAVRQFPEIEILGLHSPGGDVVAALLLALEIDERGISTMITDTSYCYSACAYIFLAGAKRTVSGELGTHMPTAAEIVPDERVAIDLDMRYVLSRLDVPPLVWDSIFNTPSTEIRIFDAAEAAALGLNR